MNAYVRACGVTPGCCPCVCVLCVQVRRRLLDVAEEQKDCKEMEGVVSLMLEAVGGERSAAVRILKLINQGVILAAVEHLHYTVCKVRLLI